MRRLLLVALLCAASVSIGHAQAPPPRIVAALYDLDATSETFPVLEAKARDEAARVQTSASSVTVTAVSGSPFTNVSVNDRLIIQSAQAGNFVRTVATRASATSITVDSALNISTGAAFQWQKMVAGTAATDGWFEMGRNPATITITIAQLVVTGGIDIRVQCASTNVDGTFRPVQVYPALTPPTFTASYTNFTAAGTFGVVIPDPWDRCRVGLKIGSADDGGDLTTNQEQITIAVEFGVR